jgi:hypothetical protein
MKERAKTGRRHGAALLVGMAQRGGQLFDRLGKIHFLRLASVDSEALVWWEFVCV